jgi:TonB family protein
VALGGAALALLLLAQANVDADADVDAGAGADARDVSDARDAATGDRQDARADGPVFEPPRARGSTTVPYPPGAPEIDEPVLVTVKLFVDATGAVTKAELRTPPHPPFDDAVLAAARGFTFEPGRYGGAPVAVEITFRQTFLPRARPVAPPDAAASDAASDAGPPGPALTAVLRGRLVELGTRAPLGHATISARVAEQYYTAESQSDGHFRLPLPAGTARVSVFASGHNPFVQQETIAAGQELAVTYLVERDLYDAYETIVVGPRRREEVSRITLRGAEIAKVPGTFGDPFRVVQTLPGVASVVSLLPFPVVRGSSPSATGFLIDGIRVPLLFHLLAGPSVVHPEFIDEIQFFPGGAPVPYGGYVGGIVDGRTRRARPDERVVDLYLDLFQSGGLVREPVPKLGATFTAAGRYGYPGFLLKLATDDVSLSYWDYQLRLDGGTATNGWTVFLFGARDQLDTPAPGSDPFSGNRPLTPELILGFHRLDLRYQRASGRLQGAARVVLGYDRTFNRQADFSTWNAEPQLLAQWLHSERLRIVGGLTGSVRDLQQGPPPDGSGDGPGDRPDAVTVITASLGNVWQQSSYLEALWRPTPAWLIRPGLRQDLWKDDTARKGAIDPRLSGRYRLLERDLPGTIPGNDDRAVWLKASAGIYHQPPRFIVPLPGLDLMPLRYGLLRSFQTSLGTEVPLRERIDLGLEGFFNYMDPTLFDLTVNDPSIMRGPNQVVPDENQDFVDRLTRSQTGRAFGLEVMLRRRAKSGLFGWISYTLSRSERYIDGRWAPYDFNRTQLFNFVAGLPLRRNWDIGVRLQYQSGRPTTTTAGYNTATGAGYFRFDFRIDKRAVYKKWLLDFYVDVTNAAVLPEEVQPGDVLRYVLPTVGFRARL